MPLAIFSLMQRPDGESGAVRLVVISLVLALGAMVASELLARRMRRVLGKDP